LEININISNYEEYLLSAVDGELSGDEMVALEAFLQQYPHIREELVLLESVRLMPDPEVSFGNKAPLYRTVNYETQLLDYIDNELHGTDKQALELLIQQHPHLQKELNILQQARLQPDLSLQFRNKAVLYRTNRNKVRPIWWWSAAAAVVAGVAVVLWAPSLSETASEKSAQIAANQPAVKKQVKAPEVQQQTNIAEQLAVNTPAVTAEQQTNTVKAQTNTQKTIKSDIKTGNTLAGNNNNTAPVTDKQQQPETDNNSNIGLTKLAQPVATSGEIVEQLQNKMNEQQIAATIEKAPVMANASTINKVSEAVTATAAPVQGELVVSVTMNGDSKLLNGVANVARFFSKKKK
jgi:anti-sigma factor RsiW